MGDTLFYFVILVFDILDTLHSCSQHYYVQQSDSLMPASIIHDTLQVKTSKVSFKIIKT